MRLVFQRNVASQSPSCETQGILDKLMTIIKCLKKFKSYHPIPANNKPLMVHNHPLLHIYHLSWKS